MVLEPSRFFQNVIETILKDAGFIVHSFSEPEDLKKELVSSGTDCAILCLSLKMKGGNSTEFTRELRAMPCLRNTPFVLVTSTSSEAEVQEALKAGITEVFYKSDLQAFNDYVHTISAKAGRNQAGSCRILYAEDSITTAGLVVTWLQRMEASVVQVKTAEDALAEFAKAPESFDLVLTDFLLAGKMSGLGLIREIRGTWGSRVPILVSSGLEDATRRVEILRSGANDYVAKPVMEEELLARVNLLINNKRLVDEVENQRRRMAMMATQDSLTGMANRYIIMEQAPVLIEKYQKEGSDLAMAVIDLDHFKNINDSFGHQKGDEALVLAARLIKQHTPDSGFSARLGGEEFLLVLPGYTGGKAWNLCEDMRVAIADGTAGEGNLKFTASIGVTSMNGRQDCTLDSLIAEADAALYEAKNKGRNRVEKART